MNYDSIAEMVNKLVKSSSSVMSSEQERFSSELAIIKNVFSKYEVSGNALTIEALPLVIWN